MTDTTLLSQPGLYHLPSSVYHADPAPEPSLSHSMARILLDRSPRHAWTAHPRLNPNFEPDPPTQAKEDGSILHALILGAGERVTPIRANDYKTRAARDARDEARALGKMPILEEHLAELQDCAASVRKQIAEDPDLAWFLEPDGESEVTLLWQMGPVWCRGLADRINRRLRRIGDLKSTIMSAKPDDIGPKIARDYAGQDFWYRLGAETLLPTPDGGEPWRFTFIAFERDAPFCISAHELPQPVMDFAKERMFQAVRTWATCLITDEWPGYAKGIHTPQLDNRTMGKAADALLQWSKGSALAA